MRGSGWTTSPWMDTAPFPEGRADLTALRPDVVVVGAGIAGVTTAYMLRRVGRSVLLLDDGPVGSGETGRTTAHLSNAIDDRYAEIERTHGVEGARLAAESHTAAIDTIERLAREEAIDCDFRRLDGWLVRAPDQDPEVLEREVAAAHRAGLTGVETVTVPPVSTAGPGPCLRFPGQGVFHPMKYVAGLVRAFEMRGGVLATGVHVTHVDDGERPIVHTDGGHRIEADAVVVATNTPMNLHYAIHTKQAPYRTYALAARAAKGAVPDARYWDTADPYHYVRLQPMDDHDLLIVGGEDHKTGEADDMEIRWARLEEWTRVHFPMAGAVDYRWSGQVMEPFDGLAFTGRAPGGTHVFVHTGDSGMGMTHGTIAGLLLCDLAQGRDHRWARLYDPSRLMTRSIGTYLSENLDVARQYSRRLRPFDIEDEAQIEPGGGAVVRRNGRPVAIHRDEAGAFHRVSAVCTHLGCLVAWNPAEKTWDCPCHGSRYAVDGTVLNGPAHAPLGKVEDRKEG